MNSIKQSIKSCSDNEQSEKHGTGPARVRVKQEDANSIRGKNMIVHKMFDKLIDK